MKTAVQIMTSSLLLVAVSAGASSISSAYTPRTPNSHQPVICVTDDCVSQLKKLKRYATNGNAVAATIVARAYSDGVGFEKNPRAALRIIKLGAAKNEPVALYQLSEWYRAGINTEVDIAKADLYLERAVALNFPQAMHTKATLLSKRQDATSQQAAVDLLHKAAGYGHQEAQYALAQLLQNEASSAENLLHAAELLRRLTLQSYKDSAEQLTTLIGKLSETKQATAEELAYLNETFNIEVVKVGHRGTFTEQLAALNERMAKIQFGRYSGISSGTRIRGQLCGEGSSNCSSFRPDDLDWLMMGTSLAPK